MVHELEVWLFADRAGTLALIDGRLSFRYVPDWLSRPDALALSASLPLQAAPLYDARSTGVYPTPTPKMAMKIGTKYKFSEVLARHWEQFAQAAGLAKAPSKRRILALARSLPAAAP